ncbi:uncharacterized protein Dwil_GK17495 [Drosophila willistoni]|uniref:Ionotropic glutamate receptor C-terminal domain-containing protein n=1 Tax=Drosophila willistoni TaxID=7260 RepID=B4MMJ2_DROWI|nr:uncharacterized protein LOC6638864 [Drosophila willistoni]EDW73337.1 uncharacterized protein Dwil_GK17495 [Drosophila willistoni]
MSSFWLFTLLALSTVNAAKQEPITVAKIACHIALNQSAQITYIYRCVTCPLSVEYKEQELELNQCIGSQLPVITRSIEIHELEPMRQTDSMNIFHIPKGHSGEFLVRRIINMLNPRQPRKHMHKYLFLWPEASLDQVQQLFEDFWFTKHMLYGLVIINPKNIYDFQPFKNTIRLKLIYKSVYFIDKLRNLHGSQLRFSMFSDPLMAIPLEPVTQAGFTALDGTAAKVLAQLLNATAIYLIPQDNETYGRCLPNGNFTGVVKDLIEGRTDFAPNSRFVLDCIWPHVEVLYPHTRRIIYLVVPAAGLKPEYLIFIRTFRPAVWLLFFVNFLLVFLIFWLLQHLLGRIPRPVNPWKWYEIMAMFAKTHLGEPVTGFAQISSLRAFLMAWILFSYVLTSIYFAKLESAFVHPTYEAPLDKLDDLSRYKSNLKVYAVVTMFEAVQSTLSAKHYQLITQRSRQLPLGLTSSYYQLAVSRWKPGRAAFIMRDFHARDFLTHTYNSQEDRPSYHIVKEYLRSMLCTYILPKGSPFLYKFQSIFTGFHEHGFFEHWRQMDVIHRTGTSSQAEEYYEGLGESDTDRDPSASAVADIRTKKKVVLTLEILQGAFYLWSVGILLSVVGFIIEHGYYWWKQYTKQDVNQ